MPLSAVNLPAIGLTLSDWEENPDIPLMHRSIAQTLSAILSFHGEEDSMSPVDWVEFKSLTCWLCLRYNHDITGAACRFGLSDACEAWSVAVHPDPFDVRSFG